MLLELPPGEELIVDRDRLLDTLPEAEGRSEALEPEGRALLRKEFEGTELLDPRALEFRLERPEARLREP